MLSLDRLAALDLSLWLRSGQEAGERLAQTGRLSDDAMGRTIEALRVCANKLRWRNVDRVRLVATEACRMAENGGAFIDRPRGEVTGGQALAQALDRGCFAVVNHPWQPAMLSLHVVVSPAFTRVPSATRRLRLWA